MVKHTCVVQHFVKLLLYPVSWLASTDMSFISLDWERGVDSHGRVYYIDHVNRTTTWNRPRTSKTYFILPQLLLCWFGTSCVNVQATKVVENRNISKGAIMP